MTDEERSRRGRPYDPEAERVLEQIQNESARGLGSVDNVRFPIPALFFTIGNSAKHSFMSRKRISAAECLRENCPVPNHVTVKDFAR